MFGFEEGCLNCFFEFVLNGLGDVFVDGVRIFWSMDFGEGVDFFELLY